MNRSLLLRLVLCLLCCPLTVRPVTVEESASERSLPGAFPVVARPPAVPGSYEALLVAQLEPYHPAQSVSGVIRLWGHGSSKIPFMKRIVDTWEQGFRRFQPGVSIEYDMHGTSSAIPVLAAGLADASILGEEIDPLAVVAFEKVRHYAPTVIEIATGSMDVRNFDYAQMFFVHRDNPLTGLTLAQLDGIFGAEHRRGPKNLRTWGDVGLTGDWASRPITPYGWFADDSFGLYLQQALLAGSHRWNESLRQFAHIYRKDGRIYDHGQQILDALSKDRYGIAVSNIRYRTPEVKPLALAEAEGKPFVEATKKSLIEGTYPLARYIPIVVDRPPGMPLDPKVREFIHYILSREGQEDVNRDGGYLPLAPEAIAEQLRLLEYAPVAATSAPGCPCKAVPGAIRIGGDPQMSGVVKAWVDGYRKGHPGASFDVSLCGTDNAMPGLYLGTSDLGLFGREINVTDHDGFAHVLQYEPFGLELMTGSLDLPGKSCALAVFVNERNPLTRLTLAELDAVFGAERRRGHSDMETWGGLGLQGAWAAAPINRYCFDLETGTGRFFAHSVLKDSLKLKWSRTLEFRDIPLPDGSVDEAGRRIALALAGDPYGIAIGDLRNARPGIKVIAIAEREEGPYLVPTRNSVAEHSYPLARTTYVYLNRPPGKPVEPRIRDFLNYVLGPEGRAAVESDGGFLPLTEARAAEQAGKLGRATP